MCSGLKHYPIVEFSLLIIINFFINNKLYNIYYYRSIIINLMDGRSQQNGRCRKSGKEL